jgi:hypothetical protein
MCLFSALSIQDLYSSSCPQSLSCSQHSELLLFLQHHLFLLLLKTLSKRSAPFALYSTCVVFLLLNQFPSELETEAEHYLSNSLVVRPMPVSLGLLYLISGTLAYW